MPPSPATRWRFSPLSARDAMVLASCVTTAGLPELPMADHELLALLGRLTLSEGKPDATSRDDAAEDGNEEVGDSHKTTARWQEEEQEERPPQCADGAESAAARAKAWFELAAEKAMESMAGGAAQKYSQLAMEIIGDGD